MASTNKIIPIIDNKPFARWMAASRAAQAFISVTVICLDIFAIDEWNKDQFSFNSYFGQASSFSLHTDIGTTPFTGIVMFTSFLTLAAIFYDQVTPYNAALFYNVYGEIILEFLLSAFWITSFAGLAGYVVQMSAPVSDLNSYVSPSGPDYGDPNVTNLAAHSTQAQDVCIAIVVLGAIVLCVCSLSTIPPRRDYLRAQVTSVLTLANIMSLIAYIVRVERGPEEEQHTGESMSPSPGHVETSVIQDKTPPQMPTSFQEV